MDFRAAAFGLSLIAASTCAFGADTPGTALSAPGGRFVFGQISSGRVDQYLLDTQTGKVWQMQCAKKAADGFSCDSALFVPIPFQWPAGAAEPYGLAPTPTPPSAAPTPSKTH
jgi:hypothetical protein